MSRIRTSGAHNQIDAEFLLLIAVGSGSLALMMFGSNYKALVVSELAGALCIFHLAERLCTHEERSIRRWFSGNAPSHIEAINVRLRKLMTCMLPVLFVCCPIGIAIRHAAEHDNSVISIGTGFIQAAVLVGARYFWELAKLRRKRTRLMALSESAA